MWRVEWLPPPAKTIDKVQTFMPIWRKSLSRWNRPREKIKLQQFIFYLDPITGVSKHIKRFAVFFIVWNHSRAFILIIGSLERLCWMICKSNPFVPGESSLFTTALSRKRYTLFKATKWKKDSFPSTAVKK